jgi:osmoprotectant transport system permease protein
VSAVGLIIRVAAAALLAAFLVAPNLFEPLLRPLAPAGAPAVYVQSSLAELAAVHLGVTALATLASAVVALALATFVTRSAGAEFLPLSRSLVNIGQTFPPVAVLAVMVPAVGFGEAPTLIALFVYGLLPIFENALAGLTATPRPVLDAARATAMTARQAFLEVELPLALPAILAGVRLSAVIGLATATIGSTVAARTLGEVVIAGLASSNTAYVVQGAASIAALAMLISDGFAVVERKAARRLGPSPGAA